MSEQGSVPKKNGCLKGCLVFVLVAVVIVVGIGAGGYFFLRSLLPEPVEYEASDVDSFYDKLGIDEANYDFTLQELLGGMVETEGMVDVDVILTSAELTGFLQSKSPRSDMGMDGLDLRKVALGNTLSLPVFKMSSTSASGTFLLNDYNVRITGEDEMELFASITEDLTAIYDLVPDLENYKSVVDRAAGATLYVKMNIVHRSSSGFNIDVIKLSVNGIPVPTNMVDEYEPDLNDLVNNRISQSELLVIDEFKLTVDGLVFKGEIPEAIRSMNR